MSTVRNLSRVDQFDRWSRMRETLRGQRLVDDLDGRRYFRSRIFAGFLLRLLTQECAFAAFISGPKLTHTFPVVQ